MTSHIAAKRRFTCYGPHVVRMEFSPDGRFIDQPSLVVGREATARPFTDITVLPDGATRLDTGAMTIVTRADHKPMGKRNLEVRYLHRGLLQCWRPGDIDHQNLGGTVRSLDRFGDTLAIAGVHPAGMDSPDAHALQWMAWLQCEEDPWFYANSPDAKRPGLGNNTHLDVRYGLPNTLERTRNAVLDHLRYSAGVLSRSGCFLLNDSDSPLIDGDGFVAERCRPGYQDWYFFAYGADYGQALSDFVAVCGAAPLPPRQCFGLWFSRWPAYDEAEAKGLVKRFADAGAPLSVIVLDMEWHTEGWGTWDWNARMYPDPTAFFTWCHAQRLLVTLNDHPLDLRSDDSHYAAYLEQAGTASRVRTIEYNGTKLPAVDIDLCDKREAKAFKAICHQPILDQGLDFWWNDGCRGGIDGAESQLVCNRLMFREVDSPERRGTLLARYGGVGSHRYGIAFTGDTLACWQILAQQCEHNIRAGHLGLAYVSHDMGGFFQHCATTHCDQLLLRRWVQFGIFNPIFRFHSAPGGGSRLPWDYHQGTSDHLVSLLQMRNSLIPYVYTAARRHHDSGRPLVRGMFFDLPGEDAAYRFDQFWFGDHLVVAPILSSENHRAVWLPPGRWWRFESGEAVAAGLHPCFSAGAGAIPAFVPAGSIIVRQDPSKDPSAPHVGHLWLDCYAGADGGAELYEDDGRSNAYLSGGGCRTRFSIACSGTTVEITGDRPNGLPLGGDREVVVTLSCACEPSAAVGPHGQPLAIERLRSGRWRLAPFHVPSDEPWTIRVTTGS
jgi:hypothetical protein